MKKWNKHGWIKIVEAFIAVFIIMSVAIFVINKSYIERRDISEKIYGVEIQLLQEIIDKFGKIKFNDYPNSPDENEIGDFIYGGGDINKRRVPDYLECGIRLCPIDELNCPYVSRKPEDAKGNPKEMDIYVQTLPIVETETFLSIECWLR